MTNFHAKKIINTLLFASLFLNTDISEARECLRQRERNDEEVHFRKEKNRVYVAISEDANRDLNPVSKTKVRGDPLKFRGDALIEPFYGKPEEKAIGLSSKKALKQLDQGLDQAKKTLKNFLNGKKSYFSEAKSIFNRMKKTAYSLLDEKDESKSNIQNPIDALTERMKQENDEIDNLMLLGTKFFQAASKRFEG